MSCWKPVPIALRLASLATWLGRGRKGSSPFQVQVDFPVELCFLLTILALSAGRRSGTFPLVGIAKRRIYWALACSDKFQNPRSWSIGRRTTRECLKPATEPLPAPTAPLGPASERSYARPSYTYCTLTATQTNIPVPACCTFDSGNVLYLEYITPSFSALIVVIPLIDSSLSTEYSDSLPSALLNLCHHSAALTGENCALSHHQEGQVQKFSDGGSRTWLGNKSRNYSMKKSRTISNGIPR